MVRHVVVWSMSEDHSSELDQLLTQLRALPDQIEEIEALSAGPLIGDSELDAALCVDLLADAEALARYRTHPAHEPVGELLRQLAERIVVADYEY